MNRSKQPRKRGSLGIAIALLLLVVGPVLYVLSTGPVLWMIINELIPEDIAVIYTPLGWLNDNFEPVESFFEWYLDLWRVR